MPLPVRVEPSTHHGLTVTVYRVNRLTGERTEPVTRFLRAVSVPECSAWPPCRCPRARATGRCAP